MVDEFRQRYNKSSPAYGGIQYFQASDYDLAGLASSFHGKLYNRGLAHTPLPPGWPQLATWLRSLLHRLRKHLSMSAEHSVIARSSRVSPSCSLISRLLREKTLVKMLCRQTPLGGTAFFSLRARPSKPTLRARSVISSRARIFRAVLNAQGCRRANHARISSATASGTLL